LCLLCYAHNLQTARRVFGEAHITKKRAQRASLPARPAVAVQVLTTSAFEQCMYASRQCRSTDGHPLVPVPGSP
jgi:hypothetical protein